MVHRLRETKVLRYECVIDGSFGAGKLTEATDIYEKRVREDAEICFKLIVAALGEATQK